MSISFKPFNNDIEMIILSLSVMPAGVPHWVLGTSNAVCVGRFFYGASTIRLSVISIVHTFLLAGALTNEEFKQTRTLLYQLLVFWCLRIDQTDIDGRFDFQSCSLVDLILQRLRGAYSRHVL